MPSLVRSEVRQENAAPTFGRVLVAPTQTIGPYRILGVIGEGGMGVVYRADRPGSIGRVAIKTVRVPRESHIAGIRREIQALLHVRHPGIVRVLDEGVESGLPWYAMELLEGRTLHDDIRALWTSPEEGPIASELRRREEAMTRDTLMEPELVAAPSSRRFAATAELPRILGVMRQLCETLAFLHGEGIIHRDIKPANVFLRGGTTPVLMDFGVAWRFPTAVGREVLDLALPMAGTIGYTAPEQLQGDIVDARADLYSVGCILYEAVTGRLPFEGCSGRSVRGDHLFTKPIPPSELVEEVSPALEEIILHLLEKRPRDRIGYAGDVARALEALGASRSPGCEPTPARAYVYRPELAGRDEALIQLTLWTQRLVGGSGGCVLVRGESGIGKTHLCMALVHAASMSGLDVIASACAAVVPSAAAASGGKAGLAAASIVSPNDAPLHVFRPLLRTIADRCLERGEELSNELLGDRAKVLAVCEPALACLPGIEGRPAPPELPAKATRARLLRALADTIEAFAKSWPLLLVLDDLQWADELSIEFLASLSNDYLNRCRVLILGTYRVEQARGRLEELGASLRAAPERGAGGAGGSTLGMMRIDLGKLDEESVAAMVGDMLAMSPPPKLFVRSLALRSEGNPFFVAEYVRVAVAEGLLSRSAAGKWQLDEAATSEDACDRLPLSASLRELCGHRLAGLSGAACELMEVASVLGREVEWGLLAGAVSMDDEQAMDASRELCARYILEEAEPGRLRFLHDKLREAAYDRIAAPRRASLHGVVASAIEARSRDEADFPLFYTKLARHFMEAGNGGKAMEYLEKAGERALKSSSNREAAGLFGELIALDEKAGGDRASERGRLTRARWARRLVEAHAGFEDLGPALGHAGRALSWAGRSLPQSRSGWILRLVREISVQVAHRIAPGALGGSEKTAAVVGGMSILEDDASRADAVEASMTLGAISRSHVFSDATIAITAGLWSVNLAERAGGGAKLASSYAVLGTMLGFCRLPGLARSYFALARGAAERTKDDVGRVTSLYTQGYWLQAQGGEWDATCAIYREAIERARGLGDTSETGFAEMFLATAELLSGRLEESRQRLAALSRGAAERANAQYFVRSLIGLSIALIRLGQLDEAKARLLEARAVLEREDNVPSKIRCLGLLALVQARTGELDQAVASADIVSAELVRGPMLIGLGVAYGGAAEAYLERLARAQESRPDEVAEARKAVRKIVSKLYLASLICPVAAPIYHHVQGRARWLDGARARARRSWERGLAAAVKLDLPYDQGIARVDLARAEPPGSAERERQLGIAEAIFSKMGCKLDLAEVEALRAGPLRRRHSTRPHAESAPAAQGVPGADLDRVARPGMTAELGWNAPCNGGAREPGTITVEVS